MLLCDVAYFDLFTCRAFGAATTAPEQLVADNGTDSDNKRTDQHNVGVRHVISRIGRH